jgi:hypothetical protein
MENWAMLVILAIGVPMAQAACRNAGTIRDWGLHRMWRVEQDCSHPERPAVLVEIAWTATDLRHDSPASSLARPPLMRAGMRIAVTWQDEDSEGRLAGTALTTGRAGETVAVRTGFGSAILYGVVRGPGWVELPRRKVGK